MFEDDRTPVPFSTSIELPPTPTNRAALMWLPAMKLPPYATRIAATLFEGGVPIFTGTLQYEGMSDGKASYTFAQKGPGDTWGGKIYELPGLDTGSPAPEAPNVFATGTNPEHTHIPYIIDAGQAAESAYYPKDYTRPDPEHRLINPDFKIRNYFGTNQLRDNVHWGLIPVIDAVFFLDALDPALDYSAISAEVSRIAIAGTWQDIVINTSDHYMGGKQTLDLADMLPDRTLMDVVAGICRMFCAFVFAVPGGYEVRKASDILESAEMDDWDGILSDDFTAGTEPAQRYTLAYGGDSTTDPSPEDTNRNSGTPAEKASMAALANESPADTEEYAPATILSTGDTVSYMATTRKYVDHPFEVVEKTDILCDVLVQSGQGKASHGSGEDERAVEIGFTLPATIPSRIYYRDTTIFTREAHAATPLMPIPALGSDRPTDIVVGVYGQGQMCDKGIVIASGEQADEDLGLSLATSALFEAYHLPLAEWTARERQVVTADVRLSALQIAAFRPWRKVHASGRAWIVRKLTVRLSASTFGPACTAELVEA